MRPDKPWHDVAAQLRPARPDLDDESDVEPPISGASCRCLATRPTTGRGAARSEGRPRLVGARPPQV
jgi:hypothetical protein